MHPAAAWQHSSNSNIKIVHNSIEHFLWNSSGFFSDDVLSCLWVVFTNSVFQVPPQLIVRWVDILGIGWPRVISLMQNESVPWEVAPKVFKCSVQEMRWCFVSRTEQMSIKHQLINIYENNKYYCRVRIVQKNNCKCIIGFNLIDMVQTDFF